MQDFNTIIGVIQMRQNECSFSVIQKRYHIGSGTTQRILSRFEAWDQRQSTKFNKLLRKATLKYPHADFDESLYEPDRKLDTHTIEKLQTCKWIDVNTAPL